MIQAGSVPATRASFAADFHDGEIMMVAERKERHFDAGFIQTRAERQTQEAIVELLGALTIADAQNDMAKCRYLHDCLPLSGLIVSFPPGEGQKLDRQCAKEYPRS